MIIRHGRSDPSPGCCARHPTVPWRAPWHSVRGSARCVGTVPPGATGAGTPRGARRDNSRPVVPQDPDMFRAMLGMPADPRSEAGSLTRERLGAGGARGTCRCMVWVHGGGYVGGSNSSPRTDGARLAAAGHVVVVALSYRLGVFGFLPSFAEVGEGFEDAANLGILDLIAGLERVRENVAPSAETQPWSPCSGSRPGPPRSRHCSGCRARAACSAGRSCRAARPSAPAPRIRRPMCRRASCTRRPDARDEPRPARVARGARARRAARIHRSGGRRSRSGCHCPTSR